MTDFCMPSLGTDMTSGILVEWLVEQGEQVNQGQSIAVIETSKGAIEIESFVDGVLVEIVREPGGDEIAIGSVLARIQEKGAERNEPEGNDSGSKETGGNVRFEFEQAGQSTKISSPAEERQTGPAAEKLRQRISPAARRLASELQVDLTAVVGTGPDGSIQRCDIETAHSRQPDSRQAEVISATAAAPPAAQRSQQGGADSMRQAIAMAMSRSNSEIPHYYLSQKINLERALAWLEERNLSLPLAQRLLPVALLVCAVASALREVPELNGRWMEGAFQPAEETGIGFSVALRSGGVMLPVLKGEALCQPEQAMAALRQLINRCRSGQLHLSDMEGASISMTNLGDLGVDSVLGVIYPPQVALVGFGKISDQPWAEEGTLSVKPVVTVSLAADHRASDGMIGARFLDRLNRALQSLEFADD